MYIVSARTKSAQGSLTHEPKKFGDEPTVGQVKEYKTATILYHRAVYTNARSVTCDIKIERKN